MAEWGFDEAILEPGEGDGGEEEGGAEGERDFAEPEIAADGIDGPVEEVEGIGDVAEPGEGADGEQGGGGRVWEGDEGEGGERDGEGGPTGVRAGRGKERDQDEAEECEPKEARDAGRREAGGQVERTDGANREFPGAAGKEVKRRVRRARSEVEGE